MDMMDTWVHKCLLELVHVLHQNYHMFMGDASAEEDYVLGALGWASERSDYSICCRR